MRPQYHGILIALLAASVYSRPSENFQQKCMNLGKKIKLDYPFTVNIAEYLAPNATIDLAAEGLNATCADTTEPITVGICRLNLKVATSEKSEVYTEVWLPEKWTGRTMTTGNGGLAGCMFTMCIDAVVNLC